MSESVYAFRSTDLDGADFVLSFVCLRLWGNGSCTYVTGTLTDHAMVERFESLVVYEGRHTSSKNTLSLHLTSRSVHESHTDEDGWTDAESSTPTPIDLERMFEIQDAHTLLDGANRDVVLRDDVDPPPQVLAVWKT